MESYGELRAAVEKVELVDAHAHNLVALDSSVPFINCFTEATGDYALSSAPHTLSFKRSLRDIAELYGCDSSLEQVHKYRQLKGVESLVSTCFKAARISTILIDDGIVLDNKYDLDWHNIAAKNVRRICRIERLAEEVLDKGLEAGIAWTLGTFTEAFTEALKSVASLVVGFKSIAAYRSGLEINTNLSDKDAEAGLNEALRAGRALRIENKNLIDHIFIHSLEVAQSFDLPVQIHTGFGDKDLDLRLANPLHLRQLLEDKRFTKCRLVLLHASYPYSKEASYLASVYPQVYLDFGLAIPKLSVHGMISSVKELLELAPINKVMFSTDGVAFPETFYLGAKHGREVVFSVLRDACIDGDLSISEAVVAAQDILANNAIHFYKIRAANKSETFENALSSPANAAIEAQETVISFVRVLWIDASGQHRCRVVPAKRFDDVVKKNGLGLTEACMGMSSSTDSPADGSNLSGVGEIRLVPELSTKYRIPWMTQEEMVLANMEVRPGVGWEYCPREVLRRVSKVLKDEFDLVMNAGFENEFYLLRNVSRDGKEEWVPFDSTPYCSTSAYDAASPFLHEVATCMRSLNIPVEQLHAESGNGQFEIALGHGVCTYSADNLIFAREVIRSVARKHGFLATFVPKYSLQGIGSGSHVHISLSKNGENVFMGSHGSSLYGISKTGQEFMAGVLRHLPSILAFTAPIPNSYDRIQPNTWSGAYLCWGRENREAPLRTACPPGISEGLVSNFEIKSFDGCANPYLGLASIIAAGIDGLRRQLTLPDPIDENPADCKSGVQMLPRSLAESIEALRNDSVMKELIGEKLLVAIDAVRKAEVNYYSKNKEAWKQLIYQY